MYIIICSKEKYRLVYQLENCQKCQKKIGDHLGIKETKKNFKKLYLLH